MKAISDKIKRKIHRIRKGSTVYAEVRKNLYDAVEQRVEFKEVRWDSKGRCHIAKTFPNDYRGMLATIHPKAEGKSGSVVFFTLMMHSTKRDINTLGDSTLCETSKPFIKDIKPRLTVNKTKSGTQLLWFKDNKPVWKVKSHHDVFAYFRRDFVGCDYILELVYEELEKIYSPEDFIPILAKMQKPVGKHFYPHGIDQKLMNRFSGTTNPRDLLNKLYGKQGQQSLSKNAFGGIGKIKSFASLVVASDIVRVAKSFPTSFFDKIKLPDYGSIPCVEIGMPNDQMRNARYFFKYFNHSKIQNELLCNIKEDSAISIGRSDLMGYEQTCFRFFDGDIWILCRDAGRMLEDICKHSTATRSRALWNNIKAFKGGIKETHDMITLEHAKIQYPEKMLSYRKDQMISLHNQRVTDDIVSVLPKKNIDLVVWGSTQNNCIGMYGERVSGKGDCPNIIVGFMNTKTNNWVGHAQITARRDGIDKWDIAQLKGKNNDALNKEDDKAIRFWLGQAFALMGDLISVYEDTTLEEEDQYRNDMDIRN